MSFRLVLTLCVCGLLAGCGFRPLYGDFDTGSAGARFLQIEIDTTKDREGQLLRAELVRLLYGSRAPEAPRYRLITVLTENTTSLAVQKSAFATRGNLIMTGAVRLIDRRSGVSVFETSSQSTVSYNILDSEFASLLAEKNARERAVRVLGQDIRLRLGGYFDRLSKGES